MIINGSKNIQKKFNNYVPKATVLTAMMIGKLNVPNVKDLSISYVRICQRINCAFFTQRTTEASFVSIVSRYLKSSEIWSKIKEKV